MALNFIIGDKKSGKTSFIINELRKNKDSYIIVPEQTLFLYEKKILNELLEEHSFNVKILSFKKLSLKLLHNDEKFNRIKLLDSDLKTLLIEKIILNNKEKLTTLKNAAANPEFSEKISMQISEFKKYLVSHEKVKETAEAEDLNKNLKDKLTDIAFVYKEYEHQISDIYLDLDDLLVTAANKVANSDEFSNTNIYIDSFTGFTGEEFYMIEALLKAGANVNIALTMLKNRNLRVGDLGYTVKKTYDKLKKLAIKNNVKICETTLENHFFESEDISFLARFYDSDDSCKYEKETSDISIVKCRNVKYECENLSSKIVEDIIKNDAKPGEMAVIVPDIKEYSDYIKENFNKFNLSFYSNEKKSVYDMPVAALLGNIFNIILSGNRMDVITAYLKSGFFFKGEEDKLYKFENFIKSTGIRAYQLMKKPFFEIIEEKKSYNFKIVDEEALFSVYNKAVLPVIKLKESILSKKTAKDYSYALFEYFNDIMLPDTLMLYAKEYEKNGDLITGKQLIQVYNYILESMERATLVLFDTKVTFDEYKSIIVSALKNKNISSIPLLCDSIFVTEPEGFFNDSYKYVYIIGANDGKMPNPVSSESIINEDERLLLLNFGIELSMSADMKIMESELKIFDILTSPENKLFISYPEYSKSGSELEYAEFISVIKELLSINEEKENIIYSTKRYLLKEALSSFSLKNIKGNQEKIAYLCQEEEYLKLIENTLEKLKNFHFGKVSVMPENMKKILGNSIRISTTNMEKYNLCAFSYFIRYVLYAKENEEFSINSAGIGSAMHLILELFSLKLKKDNLDFSDVDDTYIKENLDAIIKKASNDINNGVFNSDIKGEVFKKKLYSTAYKTINLIRQHFIKGSFKASGFEVDFGREESALEGIVFDVGEGRKVILNGVIDRVDTFKKDGEEFVRIVDYKSSEKTLDFYEVVCGLKMQLAVYLMNAMGKESIDKIKPGGMLYLTLKSPMITIASPTASDTVEAKIREKLTMKGFYLNTTDIAEAMDEGFKENSKSEIVDLELDKSGIPKNKNTLSLKEFRTLLGYVRKNIEDGGKKIYEGEFSINPVKVAGNTACDYCPYGAVCMFDNENCEMKNITKIPRDEIFTEG